MSLFCNQRVQPTHRIKSLVLRVNVLTLGNAVLAGILVGIGTYGTRYRHRAFVRALFQGATTLFLPILSYVVSSASATVSTFQQSTPTYPSGSEIAFAIACNASTHLFVDLIWAGLVNIVGIITCTMVAATDRERRNIGLPMALLVQAIWSCYLVVSLRPQMEVSFGIPYMLLPTIFALFFAKMALRYYAFLKARRSVALGHNPPLIVGYIEQLHKGRYCIPQTVEHCPPPLVVTGEHRHDVEKVPHGFFFKRLHHNQDDMTTMSNYSSLVTVDKIWLSDDKILTSAPWLKDVCLSFSLFKLLRCLFAGYTVAEAGFQEAYSFFLHVLLKDKDHERVYGVITDELSFLHDYYYSSIPIHYSNFWLPILNIFVSLLTIICCLLLALLVISECITDMKSSGVYRAQVYCWITCAAQDDNYYEYYDQRSVLFGNRGFDAVPVAILVVLVVLAEAREIATYICSKWTKVGLICSYVVNNHDKWQGSPSMQKWIGRVLRCRCKLMKHWDDKMNQCSVLVLHPRRSDPIVSLISRLLHLPDRKRNVKVPRVVKAAIVDALRSNNNNGFLADPATFLRRSLEDRSGAFLWASDGEGIADIILMWHIATGILGVRRQHQQPPSGDMIVATHLSRYCAYLVAYVPELLPDYDKWSKGLYMAVKKDSMRALAGRAARPAAESEYDKLVSLLQERAENEVLRNGVKLAEKLEREGEEAAWRLLAGFWSQMILQYIAPSENLNGHADAIARGGELITFVWALLMHAGIARRPATGERV